MNEAILACADEPVNESARPMGIGHDGTETITLSRAAREVIDGE